MSQIDPAIQREIDKAKKSTNSRGNDYSVGALSYPSDLMGNRMYGGNYVLIQINETVASKVLNEQQDQPLSEISPTDRGAMVADAKKLSTNQTIGALAGFGAAFGGIAGGVLRGNLKSGLLGMLSGGALTGGAAAVVASTAGSLTRPTKRLQTAIALHMPNQLNVKYTTNYDAEDTIDFAMAAAGFSGASDILKSIKESQGNYKDIATAAVKNAAPAAANLALRNAPGSGALSKLSGLAPNPRKEQIFKGVEFRTFTFDYQFFPRSAQESSNVLQIIRTLRMHMHPELKDENSFLYVYPSEFDIQYYTGNRENVNIHKHTSCVLTDMMVNYTPNGQFTTFEDGTPTHINVSLTFKELALLDKNKISSGIAY